MPVDIRPLLADLEAETAALTGALSAASTDSDTDPWARPTPAEGWDVHDQLTHLAYFDEAAVEAATRPEVFIAHREEALRGGEGWVESLARRFDTMSGPEAMSWFDAARARLLEVFATVDPTTRVPWYGPDMSPASAVTARIMETWAHGQDVYDALGVDHPSTPGLRQVAHLGVRTFGFSFQVHREAVPGVEPTVVLTAPDGQEWAWGPPDGRERVEGPALDFCLVVTQRRHVDDTALHTTGPVAGRWLRIAQAFAGPPGPGRTPARA